MLQPRGSDATIALDSVYLAVMILELILCIWSTVVASHICCAKPNLVSCKIAGHIDSFAHACGNSSALAMDSKP